MSTIEQAPSPGAAKKSSPQAREGAELQIFIDNFKQNIIPKWHLDKNDKMSPLVNEATQARLMAGLHDILRAYKVADQILDPILPRSEGDKFQDDSGLRAFAYILNAPQMKQWTVSPEHKWTCARQMAGSIILYASDLCPESSRFAISTDTIPKEPPKKGWAL